MIVGAMALQMNSLKYHAVGNYYLKYPWEYFMQTNMHNKFPLIVDNPNILGRFLFLCWAEPPGRELPNIFSYLGVPEYFRKKSALHVRDIPAPPNKSCMRQFLPAW